MKKKRVTLLFWKNKEFHIYWGKFSFIILSNISNKVLMRRIKKNLNHQWGFGDFNNLNDYYYK